MVQAMVNITENVNQILNIVKAKFGLKDKSEAINLVVSEYEQTLLEPELRPEYRTKIAQIAKSKHCTRAEMDKMVASCTKIITAKKLSGNYQNSKRKTTFNIFNSERRWILS